MVLREEVQQGGVEAASSGVDVTCINYYCMLNRYECQDGDTTHGLHLPNMSMDPFTHVDKSPWVNEACNNAQTTFDASSSMSPNIMRTRGDDFAIL